MSDGGWLIPLESFKEMGTLSKVLLLLGFVFLVAALAHEASFSNPLLPASLAFISLSLTVHYFSQSRTPLVYDDESVTITDWGKMWSGILLLVVTVALAGWAVFSPSQKPKPTTTGSPEISKPVNSTVSQNDYKTPPPSVPEKVSPGKDKPSHGKNQTSGNGTQAAGDSSSAIGSVTQGPCSVLQSGGSNNQATGGNCLPPERHLTSSQADELANAAALIPAPQKISVESCNMPECERFADEIYAALKRKSPSTLASGPLIALVGWNGEGEHPRGTVVCTHSLESPTTRYAQPIANALNEEKSVPVNFTKCNGLADNEIKIIIAAP